MKIEYLHEFMIFSRYLNVTHVAHELNLSQPVLSSHLASIEKELGIRLVDRKKTIKREWTQIGSITADPKLDPKRGSLTQGTKKARSENDF